MVNRFIAMVARVWSVMRGFRPFLIGPRPFGIGFPKRVLGRNTFGGKCASLFFYCFPRRFPSLIPHVPIAISGVMFVRGSSMGAGVP